ncbi:zinc ribbon domain-containing protein, partial [Staphylococcus ureilyticus]|nr:zinc ribbon domain-containing protein [Staphylococcus ureilyticus]
KCSNCGVKYARIRKVNLNKMLCGHCKGKLIEQSHF